MTTTEHGIHISVQGCSKNFGRQRVLEPTDLSIAAGETLVLLGPSGCGKTTTLRLIAGLEAPDAGRILFDSEDVTALPIEKRNVGMVFQSYALFPNMSVEENIGYGLVVRKMAPDQRRLRVQEMLEMMHIETLASRPVQQLSGGQKQRVALARAIAPRPRALLLDEPLTALDAQLRETLRVDINALLRSLGITTVYVTHDQSEAMALGDRIAVMQKGSIAQIGTPRDIYFRPQNGFVADFIGTMNRVGEHSFRPEDVTIVPVDTSDLKGQVLSCFFLDDHHRVIVKMQSGEDVSIKLPARQQALVGESVGLIIKPESAPC